MDRGAGKLLANLIQHGLAVVTLMPGCLDFDQLMGVQVDVDFLQDGRRQAPGANNDDRMKGVGGSALGAALLSSEFYSRHRRNCTVMAKKKFSKNWIHQHIQDPYVKMAQQKGYRARAAFKLTEILDTEKLLRPGQFVVDLGSTPGSWSQILRERMKGADGQVKGRIIALDILPMEPIPDVTFIQGDFREDEVLTQLQQIVGDQKLDLVVSDMAPNLSGVEAADAARVQHICELALDFAQQHLKPEGALIVKSFHGSGFSQIVNAFKGVFERVVERKPKASRDHSSETFLVGRGLK